MRVPLPQLDVPDLLDLENVVTDKDTSGVALQLNTAYELGLRDYP